MCTVPITVSLTHSQVSYTASGIQFQMERKRFPRLYTLQPLVFSYNEAYVHLIMAFGWRRVAIIYQVDPLFSAVRPVVWQGRLGSALLHAELRNVLETCKMALRRLVLALASALWLLVSLSTVYVRT